MRGTANVHAAPAKGFPFDTLFIPFYFLLFRPLYLSTYPDRGLPSAIVIVNPFEDAREWRVELSYYSRGVHMNTCSAVFCCREVVGLPAVKTLKDPHRIFDATGNFRYDSRITMRRHGGGVVRSRNAGKLSPQSIIRRGRVGGGGK